jgi:DNA-binding beta-propeller fold protein YncE
MGNRSTLGAWRAQRTERFPHPLDDQDRATSSVLVPETWMPTGTAIATIPVGDRVDDITVSPDGERIYAARSNSIVVINRWHSIVARIPIRGPAKGLAMDVAGAQLFVVHYDGSVVVINTHGYSAQTLWDGPALDVVTSPDGGHLYIAHKQAAGDSANGVVSMLDIARATTVATVPVNDVAALALSPDGSRLYAPVSCGLAHHHQHRQPCRSRNHRHRCLSGNGNC